MSKAMKQLRALKTPQLKERLDEAHKEKVKLTVGKVSGSLAKSADIQKNKKTIARLKTLVRERGDL